MRVITGTARGVKLHTPKDYRVRPTSDKIKESLFNIIYDRIYDAVFIDCFAGTGGIGIEALSRGAQKAYFIDNHRESINLIQKNLKAARLAHKAQIIKREIKPGLISITQEKADILFMDPPYDYKTSLISEIIIQISESNLMDINGIIIVEHDIGQSIDENIKEFKCFDKRKYGSTAMTYFSKFKEGE